MFTNIKINIIISSLFLSKATKSVFSITLVMQLQIDGDYKCNAEGYKRFVFSFQVFWNVMSIRILTNILEEGAAKTYHLKQS